MARYRFEDGDVDDTDPRFASAAAHAHQWHRRAFCLCREPAPEMYVARVNGKYLVKRMPSSGHQHALNCPSHAAPATLSGLGTLIGGAIDVRPDEGCTVLRVDFPLSHKRARLCSASQEDALQQATVRASRRGLTLRALLHYLWAEAGLHRWYPAMAGKRSWHVIRKYLLRAIEDKRVGTRELADLVYVPELFNVVDKAAIQRRRQAQFEQGGDQTRQGERLLLAIGELKCLEPARTAYKLTLKHVPDCPFLLPQDLAGRLRRRFASEFDFWTAFEDVHLIACFTFSIKQSRLPCVEEGYLMAVTAQWLPFGRYDERALLTTLVSHGRAFESCLRYNLPDNRQLPLAVLLDSAEPCALHIISEPTADGVACIEADSAQYGYLSWTWASSAEPMPPLPPARHAAVSECKHDGAGSRAASKPRRR